MSDVLEFAVRAASSDVSQDDNARFAALDNLEVLLLRNVLEERTAPPCLYGVGLLGFGPCCLVLSVVRYPVP